MPEDEPSVSVVISAYNYARFLPEAIDSVLTQELPVHDLVVVDDGSTDETPDVLSAYRGDAIVVRTPNRGQLAALATGFAESQGEMVVFLDADDVLLPTATKAVAAASTEARAVKVHWPMPEIDEQGRSVGRLRPTEPLPAGDLTDQLCAHGPEGAAYPPTSGNAWRRRFLDEVLPGPVDDFRLAADQYLAVLAPFHGRVVALGEPQSCYRRHDANAHSAAPLPVRARITHEHFATATALLRAACAARGRPCPWETWEDRSWTRRLERSLAELDALLPAGSRVVLVDQDEWALPAGRPWDAEPIPARAGHYDGLPVDGPSLLVELGERRRGGATHVVISDSAFWWLDAYSGLAEYLDGNCNLSVSNDRFRLYAWTDEGTTG